MRDNHDLGLAERNSKTCSCHVHTAYEVPKLIDRGRWSHAYFVQVQAVLGTGLRERPHRPQTLSARRCDDLATYNTDLEAVSQGRE